MYFVPLPISLMSLKLLATVIDSIGLFFYLIFFIIGSQCWHQRVRDPPWNSELLQALGIEPLIIGGPIPVQQSISGNRAAHTNFSHCTPLSNCEHCVACSLSGTVHSAANHCNIIGTKSSMDVVVITLQLTGDYFIVTDEQRQ